MSYHMKKTGKKNWRLHFHGISLRAFTITNYENNCIHNMEATFPLDSRRPPCGTGRRPDNRCAERRRRLHGRNSRQADGRTPVCESPSSIPEIRPLYRTRRHPVLPPYMNGGTAKRFKNKFDYEYKKPFDDENN